ncbi:MAG: GtrA family protein [Lachnospiraceae bacterium]|nr:GtrA family protein [Lachnospiraceae bacterium]
MSALIAQILKFGVVGGISFVIDFAVYSAIIAVFGKEKTTVMIAAFFGFVISVIFNYVSSMKYVFVHDENMDKRKEFTIFVILSVIGLGLNEAIIMGVLHIYDAVAMLQSGILWDFKEQIGKIIATGIVMIYNFITRKIFIEKKN